MVLFAVRMRVLPRPGRGEENHELREVRREGLDASCASFYEFVKRVLISQ